MTNQINDFELVIYILSELLKIHVIIYKYINSNKYEKKEINSGINNEIILYNYNNKYQLISLDNEKYKNENNKIGKNYTI